MSFIGLGEIVLLLIIALIIWGPGRVVEIGRTIGKTMRSLRKASSNLTAEVTRELEIEEKDRPPKPEKRH